MEGNEEIVQCWLQQHYNITIFLAEATNSVTVSNFRLSMAKGKHASQRGSLIIVFLNENVSLCVPLCESSLVYRKAFVTVNIVPMDITAAILKWQLF